MAERMLRVFSAVVVSGCAVMLRGVSRSRRCGGSRAGARVASEGRVHQWDGDLIFSPTDRNDSGVYTCVARNTAGQKQQELLVTVASE